MTSFTRRVALKTLGFGAALLGLRRDSAAKETISSASAKPLANQVDRWANTNDRVWLGENFWANPMENWSIVDGAAECQSTAGFRNIQLITHQLTNPKGTLEMSVWLECAERQDNDSAGFRIGMQSELNEYRSNCFAKNGINAGIKNGSLVLGRKTKKLAVEGAVRLAISGKPNDDGYELTLKALAENGKEIASIKNSFAADLVLGNVALASNFDPKGRTGTCSRYRFREWIVNGDAFSVEENRKFGPILWSMYSLSDSRSDEGFVLKISALTGPLGEKDNQQVELHTKQEGGWKKVSEAKLDTDAWVATMRIPNWNEKHETPYKLVYRELNRDETSRETEWTGVIKANPTGRPLRLGALTCQNDSGFPYEPVANNVVKLDCDMLYFSGDQIYESHGGYGLIRDPADRAILNYLRKFYQFGWSFREAMRNAPTLCLPDDHDVFQGNLWGEGGAKMTSAGKNTSTDGGYREPARMVNAVHKTCVGHHPDYYDPKPSKQDISVYFGDMVYGDVSFAIIADRQFKSSPSHVDTGEGRADHVEDADFDCSKLDKPGLILLGDRQEAFLKEWSNDWRGHTMKVLLSQTVFAGVATHHGRNNGYLKADLDCGGWPQTARNNAVRIIRESKALHICGDQHLATLSQYGLDKSRDSNWCFCTPAISVGYPRWWRPDEIEGLPHKNRPKHGLPNTGEFIDPLGNHAYVYAVGNPETASVTHRYERAEQKGSGFGLVTIDTKKRTYHLEAFRFSVDATDGKASNQYPGWPVTIHQDENRGENKIS